MIERELRARLAAELAARADLIKLTSIEEPYFAALEKALGEMPAARKGAAIKEVRAHLWAMVEAKRSDGLDAATAWLRATAEFGEPDKVGRALWKQWVSSGQMEDKGAPLSRTLIVFKWGFAAFWTIGVSLLLAFGPTNIFEACSWLLVLLSFAEIGRFYSSYENGKWSFAGGFLNFVSAFGILSLLFRREWQDSFWGDFLNVTTLVVALVYLPIYLRYRKQEISRRAWKTDKKFLRSPIAAEQKYRMEPRIVLTVAATFSCAFIISQGSRFLHLPAITLICAAIIAAAFTAHRWLAK